MTTPSVPAVVEVGDLVILPYAHRREQHGLPAEVGLAFEDRRNVIRVYFASLDRTFWLDVNHLQSVEAERLPVDADVLLIHHLAKQVHADLIDLYDQSPTATTWFIFSQGGALDAFATIPARVGPRLRACYVEPASMRRLRVRIELTRATTA